MTATAKLFDGGVPLMEQLRAVTDSLPKMQATNVMVSRAYYERLKAGADADSILGQAVLFGVEVVVSDHLPYKKRTGRIIQRDRFATYGPDDMFWAEPCGLAVWETEDCHIVEYEPSPIKFFARQDFAPVFNPFQRSFLSAAW